VQRHAEQIVVRIAVRPPSAGIEGQAHRTRAAQGRNAAGLPEQLGDRHLVRTVDRRRDVRVRWSIEGDASGRDLLHRHRCGELFGDRTSAVDRETVGGLSGRRVAPAVAAQV